MAVPESKISCAFFFSLAPFAQPDDADMPTFSIG